MNKEEIIDKWVSDLISKGFMSGWFGDNSHEFKAKQIDCITKAVNGDISCVGSNKRLLAIICSDYQNLKQYCFWSDSQLNSLLSLFGFENVSQIHAINNYDSVRVNEFMENGKLRKGVRFRLIAISENDLP